MNQANLFVAVASGVLLMVSMDVTGIQKRPPEQQKANTYTYTNDVAPIVKTYCLSCHSSDEDNPSELYMDDYKSLMKGGKHGVPVIAGKPDSSSMYFKLLADPPFGKQMPRGHKKITPEAVQIIHDWIEQGAKEK
jgi:hypothetical protein